MADFLDDATIIAHESGGRPYIGWKNTDLTPYIQAGKVTASGFPDWPGLPSGTFDKNGRELPSTAGGLYGITKTNYDHYAPLVGVTDFTPESQKKVKDAIMADQGPNAWLPYWSKHRSADKGLQSEGYYGGATHLNVGGSEGPAQTGTGNQALAFALLDNLITKQRYAADAEPPQSGSDLLSLIAAGAQTRQEGPKPQEASQEPKPLTPPPAPAPDPGNAFSSYVEPPSKDALPPASAMPSFSQGEAAAPPVPPETGVKVQADVPLDASTPPTPPPEEPTKPPQSGTELLNQLAGGAGMFPEPGQFPIPPGPPGPPDLPQSPVGNGAPVVEPGLMPPAEPGKFDTSLAELGKNLLQHLIVDPVKQGYETTENVLAGKGFTPEEATGVASLAMGGSIGRGGMGAGPRLPRGPGRVEPPLLSETPTGGGDPARAAGGIAEATPSVSETQAPATAAGSGSGPPTGTSNATQGSGGKQNPPAITNVKLAQSLDDDLYRLRQNGQARMIEARQAFDSLRREYRRPDLQERAYTEIEQRMVDPNAPVSDSTREIERVMAKSAARANENARWIQQNAPDIAGELRDLPTAEQGYVHRKVVGRDIPGERLDPAQRDPISGAGGRSLSKRASGVQHRRPNYVIQDNAGNRVWQKGVLGQKGELSRYGATFTDPKTGVKWTAKQPTTAEIEKNTATRYQKHYALNTMDNDLRLGRVRANIELLNEWKPRLEGAGKFFPDGAHAVIPPGSVHVDLPQLRGYAEPHIADVLNEFYAASRDDIVSYFEKANHFLIGTMFALPVRHIENVGAHYVVGRGFDWLYSNPMLAQATREVASQGPRYLRYLKAGAGLQYPSTLNENFYGVMLEKAFREQTRDPTWIAAAKGLAKDLGTNPATAIKELVKAEYAWSRRALWKVNDIFLTARIMELERQGLPMMQAIHQAEKEIPNYRIPTEVVYSRRLAQLMKSPLAIAFGRYSYGRGKALSEMVKDMVGKEATGRERVRAVGQAAVLALLGTTLYDIAKTGLNMAMQGMGLRGPDDKPLEPGGFGPIGIVRKVPEYVAAKLGLTDSQLEFAQVLSTLITPAPGTSMIESLLSGGRDPFTGQKDIEPESSTQGKLVQGAEFLAKPIYPLQLGIEAARKGIVPALGPALGYNEQYQGPPGKVTKMQRRAAKKRENRDPIQRGIGSAMEYFGLQ